MRETVRAVIVDNLNRTFLVQHRERNPADLGKWGNAGGGLDNGDTNHIECLKRELHEEFGSHIIEQITFSRKLRVNHRLDRIDHFYGVKFFGTALVSQVPEEIIDCAWFSIEEATALNLFFGFESQLAIEAIQLFGKSNLQKEFYEPDH